MRRKMGFSVHAWSANRRSRFDGASVEVPTPTRAASAASERSRRAAAGSRQNAHCRDQRRHRAGRREAPGRLGEELKKAIARFAPQHGLHLADQAQTK
jgi:hypothetical protein